MDAVNRRRIWGYPLAVLTTGALIYGGFVYKADPDPWTMLSAADMQLRMAAGLPEKGKDGQPLAVRAELLAEARTSLNTVERGAPGMPEAREYWAFLCRLEGNYDEAVKHYRLGRQAHLEPDVHDGLLFNEVRTLEEWGKTDDAIAALAAGRDSLQPKFLEDADLMMATLHGNRGDAEQAGKLAVEVAHRAGVSPMGRVRSGKILEDLGQVTQAEAAYCSAGDRFPSGLYYRARLKMTQGAVDNALELLEQAAAEAPSQLADYLKRDQADWAALEGVARFQGITSPSETTAKPGR